MYDTNILLKDLSEKNKQIYCELKKDFLGVLSNVFFHKELSFIYIIFHIWPASSNELDSQSKNLGTPELNSRYSMKQINC